MSREALQVTVNPEAIAADALSAAKKTADAVASMLVLLDAANEGFTGCYRSDSIIYSFGQPTCSAEEQREATREWLLMKGFQDIIAIIRRSVEEANVLIEISRAIKCRSLMASEVDKKVSALRRISNKANFPQLISCFEANVEEKLECSHQVLSLNRARNCLEHRRGIVGATDCDNGKNHLSIFYPCFRIYYVFDGMEFELQPNTRLPGEPDGTEIPIMLQKASKHLKFDLGKNISFSSSDFSEITFAVWFFANEIATIVRRVATLNTAAASEGIA